jgi:hypothetical protein
MEINRRFNEDTLFTMSRTDSTSAYLQAPSTPPLRRAQFMA